jgi:hypothetical protein
MRNKLEFNNLYDLLPSELTEEAVPMTRSRAQINIIAPNLRINSTIIFSFPNSAEYRNALIMRMNRIKNKNKNLDQYFWSYSVISE